MEVGDDWKGAWRCLWSKALGGSFRETHLRSALAVEGSRQRRRLDESKRRQRPLPIGATTGFQCK